MSSQPSPQRSALTVTVMATLVVALFCWKLWTASTLHLRTDEAYVWAWSKEWVLSYLDHPPMIAWFIRAGTALFGDTLVGVRASSIASMVIAELLLADIVRRRTGSAGWALFAVLAMESTLHLGGIAMIAEPSVPAVLFTSAMFWLLLRLEDTGKASLWLGIGVAAGLALLSKYTAGLLAPSVLVFLLATRQNRRWLLTPWPYLAAILAILVFSPALIWNAQHDWASFRYQGVRLSPADVRAAPVGNFIGNELSLIGLIFAPMVLWACVRVFFSGWRAQDGTVSALSFTLLFGFAFLFVRALGVDVNTSWPIIIWPAGIAAAVIWWSSRANAAGWLLRVAVGVNVCFLALVFAHVTLNPSALAGAKDPIGRDDGYDAVAREIAAMAERSGATWVGTSNYRIYAALRWYLLGEMKVVQLNERSRYLGFEVPPIGGRPGYYVFAGGEALPDVPKGSETDVPRIWRGVEFETLTVRSVTGWSPELTPKPGSELYAWPKLL